MRHPTIRLVLTSIAILLAALGAVSGTENVAQAASGAFLDATDDLKNSASRHYAVKQGNPMTPATIDERFTVSADNDADGPTSNISARPQTASTSTVVTFPDSNLEGAIRSALNKPTGDITSDDMTTLTILSATARGIQDLTGIEHATNLTSLSLGSNQISDISALVANVRISSGDIVDIQNNPLSQQSYDTFIPQLQARGVDVKFTPSPTAVPALTPWALVGVTVLLALFVFQRMGQRKV